MKLNEKPTKLEHLIPPDKFAYQAVTEFVNRLNSRVCLFGEPGTGKSMAAQVMLASRVPGLQSGDIIQLNASVDSGIQKLRDSFGSVMHFGDNPDGLRVLLIEEVDRLSSEARPALKGLLDGLETLTNAIPIIMTTNVVDKIDDAVADRFEMVHWPNPPKEKILERVKAVLAANNTQMDDAEILRLISEAKCGMRRLFWRALPRALEKH